jgi:hypothetical protein
MTGEILQELGADIPGLIPEAGIESRLAAAGLIGIVSYFDTRALQHTHHIEGRLRIQLIDKTWYE